MEPKERPLDFSSRIAFPSTSSASAAHGAPAATGSSRPSNFTPTVAARGTLTSSGGLNKPKRLSEQNMRQFDLELQTNPKIPLEKREMDLIDRRVTEYLASLDKHTRSQLSKSQLMKSYEKTVEYKKQCTKYAFSKTFPKEYFSEDVDPGIYLDPAFKHLLPNAASRKYMTVNIADRDRHKLTGAAFEAKQLPKIDEAVSQFVKASGRPEMSMADWLNRRSALIQERDRLRKWVSGFLNENPEHATKMNVDDVIKIWQQKRREYTLDQWISIYYLEDLAKLSVNDLLREYRSEIPQGPYNAEIEEQSYTPTSSPPMSPIAVRSNMSTVNSKPTPSNSTGAGNSNLSSFSPAPQVGASGQGGVSQRLQPLRGAGAAAGSFVYQPRQYRGNNQ